MPKRLKPVARVHDLAAAAYANLAEQLASLASKRDLLLIGPALPNGGQWCRIFAFAIDGPSISTLAVELGPDIPNEHHQALMMNRLGRRFLDVRSFSDMKTMALAARDAWPCVRADEFLSSTDNGAGFSFRDFSK